jgi:hypothetical protein
MHQNDLPKKIFPNKIPVGLIESCDSKCEQEHLSRNEWLQEVLNIVTKCNLSLEEIKKKLEVK